MVFQVRKDTSPVALSSGVLSEFTALLRLMPARAAHFTEGEDEVHLGMAELGSEPKALEAAVVRGSKTRQFECPGGGHCAPRPGGEKAVKTQEGTPPASLLYLGSKLPRGSCLPLHARVLARLCPLVRTSGCATHDKVAARPEL